MKKNRNRVLKSLDLLFIYVAVPLFTAYQLHGIYNLVPLLGMGILLFVLLFRSKHFYNRRFVRLVPVNWKLLVGRFVLLSALVYCFIRFFHRGMLYYLPQENFDRYLLAVALYPFWSVIPQEIVYRAWYYHRYGDLFPSDKVSVLLNSAFFGFSHIVFGNWVAICGTFLISFVFSHTYRKYNSLPVVVIEHFFYGVMIFPWGWAGSLNRKGYRRRARLVVFQSLHLRLVSSNQDKSKHKMGDSTCRQHGKRMWLLPKETAWTD